MQPPSTRTGVVSVRGIKTATVVKNEKLTTDTEYSVQTEIVFNHARENAGTEYLVLS